MGIGMRIDPKPADATTTAKKAAALQIGEAISTEDYFFSIGTESYQMPANIKASQRLRTKGGKVIRMIYDVIPVSSHSGSTKKPVRSSGCDEPSATKLRLATNNFELQPQ